MTAFSKIALIGLGLIGSSLGHAIKRAALTATVSGHARSGETRKAALEIGFVDEVHDAPADACIDADLVMICTPLGAYQAVMGEIAPALRPGALVSDVGSVKTTALRDLKAHLPDGVQLIGGHPIAGTEESGPRAGFAELFDDRWCVLTPEGNADPETVDKLGAFWRGLGAQVEIMTPEHHDLVLAITSHVPHLIAYNIVGTAADLEHVTQSEVIKFSAGGFRDFTRIAASDPTMWRDVFLANKEAVLEMLARFNEDLTALQRAIRWDDGDALFNLFARTREIRRGIIEAGQDMPGPDFGRSQAHKKSDT